MFDFNLVIAFAYPPSLLITIPEAVKNDKPAILCSNTSLEICSKFLASTVPPFESKDLK